MKNQNVSLTLKADEDGYGIEIPDTKAPGKKFMVFYCAALLLLMIFGEAGCRIQEARFDELTRLAGIETDKGIAGHHFTEVYKHFFLSLEGHGN